ncbi:ABC transporter ATP-binding protein [Oceanirhabdus sp. W0125-5]|uniref:ABC transporter ATP-binding protein n=1 Tax=Oceanirhabdus sp. W0125-5 TaxID=2999116 RepID=UPI0022F2FC2A|nr:ABC transporter ATP-binding protein [Oceanirhabdus sp. W0125-5]WBW97107.1 ABC transporter ATP-binding protein [Oceanirhabdus sp. W0125-5]
MIEINNLYVSYKNKDKHIDAIENINLSVDEGEICVVIGPSGCGKSTLLKVLAGIHSEYKGKVLINKNQINPKNHRIGFIPQNYGLVKWKSVEENVYLSAKIKDGKNSIDKGFYNRILKELDIDKLVKRYPKELSGGQMQRVSIARALLMKPNLLLMDESFSSLDAMIREEVQELFLQVWREYKVTTLMVTHDIREAIYLGQKIAVISSYPGKVVQVIKNPLFGKRDMEFKKEFIDMNIRLKNILKGER